MNSQALAQMRAGNGCTGTWLSMGSPVVAELAALSGFDWLLFDLEHGCADSAGLLSQLQAIRGTRSAAIVRVGAPQADIILKVLDWGAEGVMAPHVSSAVEAGEYVRAMRYPPRGIRGFSRTIRTYDYGLNPPAREVPDPFFMAQIESVEGVLHAREIAAVDGVDALFVGPADLNFDLSHRENPGVNYEECLIEVAKAAKESGKACGILVRDGKETAKLKELGYTHLAVDSDISILRKAYVEILK